MGKFIIPCINSDYIRNSYARRILSLNNVKDLSLMPALILHYAEIKRGLTSRNKPKNISAYKNRIDRLCTDGLHDGSIDDSVIRVVYSLINELRIDSETCICNSDSNIVMADMFYKFIPDSFFILYSMSPYEAFSYKKNLQGFEHSISDIISFVNNWIIDTSLLKQYIESWDNDRYLLFSSSDYVEAEFIETLKKKVPDISDVNFERNRYDMKARIRRPVPIKGQPLNDFHKETITSMLSDDSSKELMNFFGYEIL